MHSQELETARSESQAYSQLASDYHTTRTRAKCLTFIHHHPVSVFKSNYYFPQILILQDRGILDLFENVLIVAPYVIESQMPQELSQIEYKCFKLFEHHHFASASRLGKMLQYILAFTRLRKIIRDSHILYIHSPSWLGLLASLWSQIYCRVLISNFTGNWSRIPPERQTKKTLLTSILVRIMKLLMNYEARQSALIFTIGEDVAQTISPNVQAKVVPVFHSSVRDSDFHIREDTCLAQSLVLLYVGRVNAGQKAFDVLLSAAYELQNRGLKFQLKCVGPIDENLAKYYRGTQPPPWLKMLGSVKFGPKLLQEYRDADIFLHVTRHEGFAKAPIEALSQSLPVVMTQVGGSNSIFIHRENCIIVPINDPIATADAVLDISRSPDLRKHLIAKGLSTARLFTIDKSRTIFQEKVSQLLDDLFYK